MSVSRSLILLGLALFAAGCSDDIGPHTTAVQPPLTPAPHFLRWAGSLPPQFRAINASQTGDEILRTSGGPSFDVASEPTGLSLDQNTATFWAVRGERRSVQINYLSFTGDTSSPFLRLDITDPTYAPGLGALAPGDSVLITVTIDPYNIKVSLEPTGLEFGDPAQLQLSYGGANGDLNGDGVVDDADAYIETQLLGMWYREGVDDAWARIPAVPLLSDKSFLSSLPHFCQYAVSW